MLDLGVLGSGVESWALDLNEEGTVVGFSVDYGGRARPVIWTDGKAQELQTELERMTSGQGLDLEGEVPAINDDGIMIRTRLSPFSGQMTAQLWRPGEDPLSIGDLGLEMKALNNSLAGCGVFMEEGKPQLPVRVQERQVSKLCLLGGSGGRAHDINEKGWIAGSCETADGVLHACIWRGEEVEDLGALEDFPHSEARGLNDHGLVVGSAHEHMARPGEECALLFAGKVIDLNDLIPADSGWVLRRAYDINREGIIVGYGIHDGRSEAFLLQPK